MNGPAAGTRSHTISGKPRVIIAEDTPKLEHKENKIREKSEKTGTKEMQKLVSDFF